MENRLLGGQRRLAFSRLSMNLLTPAKGAAALASADPIDGHPVDHPEFTDLPRVDVALRKVDGRYAKRGMARD